jgi:hypothetical protein
MLPIAKQNIKAMCNRANNSSLLPSHKFSLPMDKKISVPEKHRPEDENNGYLAASWNQKLLAGE